MKKIRLIIVTVIIFTMCMFIAPSILNAFPAYFDGNGHYYTIATPGQPWTDARDAAESMTFKPDPEGPTYCGHLVTITSQEEQDFIFNNFQGSGANSIGAYQTSDTDGFGINDKWDIDWNWVTGENWDYTNWGGGEPNDADDDEDWAAFRDDGTWNDISNDPLDGFIVEYEICHETEEETEEPVWIRTQEMTCKQVWINEDNKFQFSFIYPYRDNNWVKIYDMSGKEVFSIDMPYDNPNIIVDLPNGTYTVKTFTVGSTEPIQTFVIGK